MPTASAHRYTFVAIILHWLIALGVISMIPMGLWMSDAIKDPDQQQLAYRIFQLHKSVGFLILFLTVVRLGWRLGHPVPALPAAMPTWERFAARGTHAAFYALLLLLPLTGWIYVSSGWAIAYDKALNVATSWFGLFQIPHLSVFTGLGEATRRSVAFSSMGAHEFMAWGAVALVVLHIGAALKHQLLDKDTIVAGMAPWLKTDEPGPTAPNRGAAPLIAGAALIVLIGVVGWFASRPADSGAAASAPAEAPKAAVAKAEAPITPGAATAWTIDQTTSTITFSGAHAGNPFLGRFEDWEGHIWFDPANLAGSKVVVLVKTGSARTGDATQEASLSETEWFDPASFPTARFEAVEFKALGGARYEAKGTLRLKDKTVPVTLPFTLKTTGQAAEAKGELMLDREALNMGLYSDPTGQWVTSQIKVKIAVQAKRAQ
jgi:cytochrome b561